MLNLDKEKYYLLACSFGPDSMALFDMLEKEDFHFSAALVNYHLREESDSEMNSFISYCKEHKISYHIKDLKSGIKGKNIEAECRKIRYEFFAELVNAFNYDAVLVAHNQDDLLETYLMQKKRQNLVNFYGIKEKIEINDVLIIRPLLNFTKQELLDYCDKNSVPYSIDKSNFDESYLRNKIRHNIVSKMDATQRAEMLRELSLKNEENEKIYRKLKQCDLHDVKTLNSFSELELSIALNLLVKDIDKSLHVSLKQIKEIKKILLSGQGNIDIPIKKNTYFRLSYERLDCAKLGNNKISYEFIIEKPKELDCEYFYLNFLNDSENRNVHLSDYPLTIRNFRKGDKYQIKDYEVQVRRLFIDWKMPISLRERWPIIVNKDNKIIYIPRYQKDFAPTMNCNFYVK